MSFTGTVIDTDGTMYVTKAETIQQAAKSAAEILRALPVHADAHRALRRLADEVMTLDRPCVLLHDELDITVRITGG